MAPPSPTVGCESRILQQPLPLGIGPRHPLLLGNGRFGDGLLSCFGLDVGGWD